MAKVLYCAVPANVCEKIEVRYFVCVALQVALGARAAMDGGV